jgi:hypothetical protein
MSIEVEWLETTCDRVSSHDGGSMWLFLLAIELWNKYETEQGNHGKMENTRWDGR